MVFSSAEYKERIEDVLAASVADFVLDPQLREACEYAIVSGGKRIRPLLCLALVSDLGGELVPDALYGAAALEFIHAASLVHDDLPALDNDDLRRGRPSLHKKFGEATAILCGDALIGCAFEQLASVRYYSPVTVLGAVRSLSTANTKLCEGQQRDLSGEVDGAHLARTRELKTGALFQAASEIAALFALGTISPAVQDFGKHFGVFFQIVDDIRDGDLAPDSALWREAEMSCEVLLHRLEEVHSCAAEGARYYLDQLKLVSVPTQSASANL